MKLEGRIKGASNINPCPECGHTWFVVAYVRKGIWGCVCCNCNTEYIKPVNTPEEMIPGIGPTKGL